MQFGNQSAFNALGVSASLVIALLGQPVFAQNGALPDNVSMVTLNTQMSPAGQTVITPKGYVVPVPGAGVNGPVLQVFMGSRGGFWYVDKNGQQVDLTPTVQRLQGSVIQSQPKAAAPQYAPPPQIYAAAPAYSQPAPTNNTNAALASATAAGLGAMTGAAIANSSNSNSWNHMPYGTPIHYGSDSKVYYNSGNKTVYAANPETDKAVAYHPENSMQQQQNWYKEQQAKQTSAYKNWQKPTSNPFVADGQEMNKYHAEGGEASRARVEGRARMAGFRR
jgi:hypothetical protein